MADSAMTSLDSLPQEIIALILQSCDSFRQIQSLIFTCKRVQSVWISNQRSILWPIAQLEITGFSDALIAVGLTPSRLIYIKLTTCQVRATQIATNSLLKEELPPDPFPVSGLNGDANRPSLRELKQVQTLHRAANYVEKAILSYYHPDRFISMPNELETERDECARVKWQVWREECHRAIYRNLAAGAILCRPYHAPIVSVERPRDFLAAFLEIMEGSEHPFNVIDGWFSASEQRYLSKIPLYSSKDYHKSEAAFRPLEDLFIEESRKREPFDPSEMLAPVKSSRDESLFKTFGRYVEIRNPQSLDPDHAENVFHQILHFIAMVEEEPLKFFWDPKDEKLQSDDIPDDSPSALVMFFGSFVPIRISLQAKTKMSGTLALPGLNAKMIKDSNYFGFQYMDAFLNITWGVGSLPNCYGEDTKRPPPPQFYFAEYMLRKYFCLRFADAIYESAWDAFAHYGALFTNLESHLWYDNVGLFQSSDDPIPAIHYKPVVA